jgi:class 3 adenylate cyclase
VNAPETRYASSGDVSIAYQVVGDAPVDLLLAMGIPHSMDAFWDLEPARRFLARLATFSRLILFDRRGVGLSDPATSGDPPTLEQWMGDAIAVLDACGSKRSAVLGCDVIGGQVALLLAATSVERVPAVVVMNGAAYVGDRTDVGRSTRGWSGDADDSKNWLASDEGFSTLAPSWVGNDEHHEWWTRSIRRSASPVLMNILTGVRNRSDVRQILPTVKVPTLVMHRRGNKAFPVDLGRSIAEQVPTARFVELDGDDQFLFAGSQDDVLEEIEEFITGTRPPAALDRVLATVLFSDIVRSTEELAIHGDRNWRDTLSAHDAAVRRQLSRHNGREINTTGDGFVATFDGPARAIKCAIAIRDAVQRLGLGIRIGLHIGEVELRDDDIAGIAVVTGRRICDTGDDGDILVSRTVTDLVAGSGLEFEDRGEHELKGVPGTWRLFAVK